MSDSILATRFSGAIAFGVIVGILLVSTVPAFAQFSPQFTLLFTLTNSGDITVIQGFSGSNTINVIEMGTGIGIIPITIVDCPDSMGLPVGATCSFSRTSKPGVGSYSSTLTIFTTSATPIGSFPITVSGQKVINAETTLTRTTTFLLNVLAPPVGGYLQPINKAEVLSMILLEGASGYWWVLAIAAILALAAVLLRRRES